MRPRHAPLAALAAAASLLAGPAGAQPATAEARARAAALYDQGLTKFAHAEFAAAARAFLDADAILPSRDAILNAVKAARQASDFLLVTRAAQRAIDRGDAVVEAREALADAAMRLARIELSCTPSPCLIALDGAPADAPTAWALPGTHHFEAKNAAGDTAHQDLPCLAGATYRVALTLPVPETPPGPGDRVPPARHGLPRAVFWTGVGATAVLAGVTVWSGADAISAKNALTSPSTMAAEDSVRSDARRTDWLLLGAGLTAIATTVVGVWLTDWAPTSAAPVGGTPTHPAPAAAIVPLPGGAALSATVAF